MISRHFPPSTHRAALLALGLCGLAACVRYQARPISPEKTAAAFSARSLSDEGLRRFLTENLPNPPATWPPPAWNFEMLSWVAFYFQPSLEVARAQWNVTRSTVKTAAAHPNPTLTAIPGYDTSVSGGVSPWFPSIGLDFLLETAGKRDHRVAMANLAAEAARLDVLASAWQVRSELRRALVEMATAERRRGLLGEQAELQRQVVSLLERRREAGAVSATDVAAAQVALVKAEAAAADAERQAPLARQRVAQALGIPAAALENAPLADLLAASPPLLPAEELAAARRAALQSRADILGALARYGAAEAALQLEVARQYPDLHFGPGYQYDLGENKWSLALGLELPIFHQNQGLLAEAEAGRQQAAAQFIATQARAIAEIDGAMAAQAAAADQLDRLRRVATALEQQTARVEARLAAGGADRLDRQNARLELAVGRLALLEAEAAAAAAAGQLEGALQVPFHHLPAVVTAPDSTTASSSSP